MKTFRQLAMGLLALMIGIALPSCSDDDDENKENTEQEAQQGMLELFHLQTNLCLVNLKGEPTEATFGVAVSEANTAERIYYTKDLATAKKRFQMLFYSDTRCSEDGCTYTLANKQGTATFTESSGNKGELAVATFDVPGLKGLVKKIHFIDYTQRGENASWNDFDKMTRGNIVQVKVNDTEWYAIALAPLKGSEDTWLLFTPSIQKDLDNYRPTGYTDQTMNLDNSEKINIQDYIQSYSKEDYDHLYRQVFTFLFDEEYSDAYANEDYLRNLYVEYWRWDGWNYKTMFFQVEKETEIYEPKNYFTPNWSLKVVINRYHMLFGWEKYDSRTSVWNVSTTTNSSTYGTTTTDAEYPDDFAVGLPLWITVSTVTKWDCIEIMQ